MPFTAIVVTAVILAAIILPMFLLKSFASVSSGRRRRRRGRRVGFERRDPSEYENKTKEDVIDETKDRVRRFLDKHDIEYEVDKDIDVEGEDVTTPFYLTDRDTAILLDEWYKEYQLTKRSDISTVIVELYGTAEYQYESLRRALGIEPDWRKKVSWEVTETGSGVSDAEVLGLEDEDEVSMEELRSAYRDRIMETHPDQNDSKDAEDEFMRVKEAYESIKEEIEAVSQ